MTGMWLYCRLPLYAMHVNDTLYSAFSYFFSKTLFDFKKSISGPIELKFSGKTLNSILYAPIYFWSSNFSLKGKFAP